MELDPKGLATRRAVLGDAYVDTALSKVTPFTEPLKRAGLTVFHVVPTLKAALKAAVAGVDGHVHARVLVVATLLRQQEAGT